MPDSIQKKKKSISRQAVLVMIFAFFVIGGGGYYYYTTFAPQEAESVVELGTKRQLHVRRVDWEKTVYDHGVLKKLKNPLSGPLEIGPLGNPHPFRTPAAQ